MKYFCIAFRLAFHFGSYDLLSTWRCSNRCLLWTMSMPSAQPSLCERPTDYRTRVCLHCDRCIVGTDVQTPLYTAAWMAAWTAAETAVFSLVFMLQNVALVRTRVRVLYAVTLFWEKRFFWRSNASCKKNELCRVATLPLSLQLRRSQSELQKK